MEAHLTNIIERLIVATGPDRELDRVIALAVGDLHLDENDRLYRVDPDDGGRVYSGQSDDFLIFDYSASIDATVALTERMLPGWELVSWSRCARLIHPTNRNYDIRASGYSRALAALLALFRALEAQTKDLPNV